MGLEPIGHAGGRMTACPTITARLATMTAGDWDVGQSMAGPVWIASRHNAETFRVASIQITSREQDDAIGIVQAHRVYKFLAGEGADERLARILCYKLGYRIEQWPEFLPAARAILSKVERVAKGEGE